MPPVGGNASRLVCRVWFHGAAKILHVWNPCVWRPGLCRLSLVEFLSFRCGGPFVVLWYVCGMFGMPEYYTLGRARKEGQCQQSSCHWPIRPIQPIQPTPATAAVARASAPVTESIVFPAGPTSSAVSAMRGKFQEESTVPPFVEASLTLPSLRATMTLIYHPSVLKKWWCGVKDRLSVKHHRVKSSSTVPLVRWHVRAINVLFKASVKC